MNKSNNNTDKKVIADDAFITAYVKKWIFGFWKVKIKIIGSELVVFRKNMSTEIFRTKLSETQVGERYIGLPELQERELNRIVIKGPNGSLRISFINPMLFRLAFIVFGIIALPMIIKLGVGASIFLVLVVIPAIVAAINRFQDRDTDAVLFRDLMIKNGVWHKTKSPPQILDPQSKMGSRIQKAVDGAAYIFIVLFIGSLSILILALGLRFMFVDNLFPYGDYIETGIALAISGLILVPAAFYMYKWFMALRTKRQKLSNDFNKRYSGQDSPSPDDYAAFEYTYKKHVSKEMLKVVFVGIGFFAVPMFITFGTIFFVTRFGTGEGQKISQEFISAMAINDFAQAKTKLCEDVKPEPNIFKQAITAELKQIAVNARLPLQDFQYHSVEVYGSKKRYIYKHSLDPKLAQLNVVLEKENRKPCIKFANVLLGYRSVEIGKDDYLELRELVK